MDNSEKDDSTDRQHAVDDGSLRTIAVRGGTQTAGGGDLRRSASMAGPHVLGRKSGRLQALFYQFEGESNTAPQEVIESEGVWRCLAVSKLGQVKLCAGGWHTGPRFGKQTCIDEVDYDVDAYPEPSPQNGQ